MNDFELQLKLKSVPVPERTEEYWENFPAQVRVNLRRAAPRPDLRESWLPLLAWKFTASFACLAVGLMVFCQPLKAASSAIFQKERFVRQQLAAIPKHLRVLMSDEHGLHYLIAEKE
jgi:hypothetical protein